MSKARKSTSKLLTQTAETPMAETPMAAPSPAPEAIAEPAAPVAAPLEVAVPQVEAAMPLEALAAPAAEAETMKPFAMIQEQFRASAESSITQMRGQYSAMKDKAENATDKLEESLQAAQSGTKAFGLKMFDLFRAQTNAGLEHFQALFQTRSLADALALQQKFASAQIANLQAQSREFTELAQKVAAEIAEPVKSSIVVSLRR